MKVKVVEFITRMNIGGPSFHVLSLSQALRKAGWETLIITGKVTEEEGSLEEDAKKTGLPINFISELTSRVNPLNDLIALFKLILSLKKEKPLIIHSHTAKAGFLARISALFLKIFLGMKIKVIHTYHGFIFEGYFSRPVSKLVLLTEKLLAKFTDRIICVSESLKEIATKKFALAPLSKVTVIPYGIPSLNSMPRNREGITNVFTFGIVGRIVPIKGHELFLRSVRMLIEKVGKDAPIHFLVVGDGPERIRMENFARELSINSKVRFTGWRKDFIYDDIDALCVTSKNEGLPLVILECLQHSKPVIAVDVGGIRDVFTPVEERDDFIICSEGILVKKSDPQTISSAMMLLFRNPELCKKMGDNGRRRVIENYGETKMFNQFKLLLRELIDEA